MVRKSLSNLKSKHLFYFTETYCYSVKYINKIDLMKGGMIVGPVTPEESGLYISLY